MLKSKFSAKKIRQFSVNSLTKKLKEYHYHEPAKVAQKLKKLAQEALQIDPIQLQLLSKGLESLVLVYQSLSDSCLTLQEQMARLLVQTPYSMLLSVPGVAVVRASTIAAELGHPDKWKSLEQTMSYAGLAPRTYQTGGDEKAARTGTLPNKCNRRLKNALLQSAHQTGTYKHVAGKYDSRFHDHRLKRHYEKVEARDGVSGVSTARLFVRIMRVMVQQEALYLPQHSRGEEIQLSPEELSAYLYHTFQKVDNTLAKYDLKGIEGNKIEIIKVQWQSTLKALHDIDMSF